MNLTNLLIVTSAAAKPMGRGASIVFCASEAEENDFCSSAASVNKIKIYVYCCSKERTDTLERNQYYSLRVEHVEVETGLVQA